MAAGDVIEGTVKRLTDFGAFVEVLPGIDGLVHISQISHKRVENPKDVLKVGQEVTVKVLEVNAADERVSLSIKALEERPAQEEGENKKNVNLVHVVQNKKNATLIFQKLKLDSQWLTCLAISNCNIQKRLGQKSQPLNYFWIVEQDAVVECDSTTLISSALQPYSTVRRWGRRNRILTNYRFLSHSLFTCKIF